jgi:hypothetical protein
MYNCRTSTLFADKIFLFSNNKKFQAQNQPLCQRFIKISFFFASRTKILLW